MGMTLRCTMGPCVGQAIAVDSELVLGRGAPDPGHLGGDARLSRRHARISFDAQGRPVIEDLGSTNGTWLNDERLSAPHRCVTGDILRVGQSTFELDVAPPPAPMVASRAAATVADRPAPTPVLQMTKGLLEGEDIPLDHELLLGRSYGEPGALGGDRRLSRRHARIARGPGGVYFIEDTGSTNGTSVNGTNLRRPRALRDGDEIEIGSSRLLAHGFPAVPVHLEPADSVQMPSPVASAPFASPAPLAPPAPPASAPLAPPAPPASPPPRAAPPPPASAPPAGAARQFVPQGAAVARLSSHRGRVVGLFAAAFVASTAVAVAVVLLAAPLGSRSCPEGFICHPPPSTPPLHSATTFTGSLGWHIEYDPQLAKATTANAAGNEVVLNETSMYDQHVLGTASNSNLIGIFVRAYPSSRTSPAAAENALKSDLSAHLVGSVTAPSSDQFFTRPALGFHPAVGEVLEGNAQTPQGPGPLVKVAVMSAASGGVTIALGIAYPVQRGQSPGENPDRAFDAFGDQLLGTVRFPGDGAA